jgi:hypothetical protein
MSNGAGPSPPPTQDPASLPQAPNVNYPAVNTPFFQTVNAIWPQLVNQQAVVSPPRNGMDRFTGALLQGCPCEQWRSCSCQPRHRPRRQRRICSSGSSSGLPCSTAASISSSSRNVAISVRNSASHSEPAAPGSA